MDVDLANGDMQRFHVAELLEKTLDVSSWKGDEHIKGVFFTGIHGVTANKVLAIRVKHTEHEAPEVFYSFSALDSDEHPKVSEDYPFQNMKVRPKKHFLLFDREEVKKPDLSKIFDYPYTFGKIKVASGEMKGVLDAVSNKRERERSIASVDIVDNKMKLRVLRPQAKRKKVLAEGTFDCDVLEEIADEEFRCFLNAHTLSYVLGIFSPFPYVLFHFGRDRIMITEENDGQNPNVEVVVSQIKTV